MGTSSISALPRFSMVDGEPAVLIFFRYSAAENSGLGIFLNNSSLRPMIAFITSIITKASLGTNWALFSRSPLSLYKIKKQKINYEYYATLQNHYLNSFKSKKVITKLKDFGKDASKNDEEVEVVEHPDGSHNRIP